MAKRKHSQKLKATSGNNDSSPFKILKDRKVDILSRPVKKLDISYGKEIVDKRVFRMKHGSRQAIVNLAYLTKKVKVCNQTIIIERALYTEYMNDLQSSIEKSKLKHNNELYATFRKAVLNDPPAWVTAELLEDVYVWRQTKDVLKSIRRWTNENNRSKNVDIREQKELNSLIK